MTVVQIGPFIGRVEVDLDDHLILAIYHVNDIHRISQYDMDGLFEDRPNWESVPSCFAEEALLAWLDAGEEDLLKDLTTNEAPIRVKQTLSMMHYHINKVRTRVDGTHYHKSPPHDRSIQMECLLDFITESGYAGLDDLKAELTGSRDLLLKGSDPGVRLVDIPLYGAMQESLETYLERVAFITTAPRWQEDQKSITDLEEVLKRLNADQVRYTRDLRDLPIRDLPKDDYDEIGRLWREINNLEMRIKLMLDGMGSEE